VLKIRITSKCSFFMNSNRLLYFVIPLVAKSLEASPVEIKIENFARRSAISYTWSCLCLCYTQKNDNKNFRSCMT